MIPAGYESKRHHYHFIDDDDDDDEFEFEFGDDKKPTTSVAFEAKQDSVTHLTDEVENVVESGVEVTNEHDRASNNSYQYCNETARVLEDLRIAIRSDNPEQVAHILKQNDVDVNYDQFALHWTPLMYAVSAGSMLVAEHLISIGADVQFAHDSFTLLHCACKAEFKSVEMATFLIDKGIDINVADKFYQTPLMYASRDNHLQLLECLIQLNADLDAQDDNCWTALCHAAHRGNSECVQKLLLAGADPTIYTVDYFYPWDLASNAGYLNTSRLLKRYVRTQRLERANFTNDDASANIDAFLDLENNEETNTDQNKKLIDQDLETFLTRLKLPHLLQLFRKCEVSLNRLLNLTDLDLLDIGVSDFYQRDLILQETKKFHMKNWKSSCLIPIRQDFSVNEVIAMMSNLARCMAYMSTNVKFIAAQATEGKKDIFADKFMNSKMLIESKQAFTTSTELAEQVRLLHQKIAHVVTDLSPQPADSISHKNSVNWYAKNRKLTVTVSSTIVALAGVYALFLRKMLKSTSLIS